MKNNQGNQTENVKQALICHIRDKHLKPGDRLPSQTELRQSLGVGAVTIQRAITSLKAAGILETLPHKGVIVKDIQVNGFVGREIGLVCLWRTHQPSSASLLQCVQLQLHQAACQCKLFLRSFPEMTNVDSLDYFDGLRRCIRQKRIQGLLTTVSFDAEAWDFFRKYHLPVVSFDTASQNDGYKVKTGDIVLDAIALAHERGFRRPALFSGGYPFTEKIRRQFMESTDLSPDMYCHFMNPEIIVEDIPIDWRPTLSRLLDHYASMPDAWKPDVLILPDDFIALIVNDYLLHLRLRGIQWQPHLIYMTHKQVPMIPKGMIRGDCFEFDIMQYSDKAVSLLLDIIRGKEKQERCIIVKPELHRLETLGDTDSTISENQCAMSFPL